MTTARSSSSTVFVGLALASLFSGCSSADLTVADPAGADASGADVSGADGTIGVDAPGADAGDAGAIDASSGDLGVDADGDAIAPDGGGEACAPNPCGGCGGPAGSVGDACDKCGTLVCVGTKLSCVADSEPNTCGGCGGPTGSVGDPCTASEQCGATLKCAGIGRKDQLTCSGTAGVANACGGCEVLAYAPGTPCDSCGDDWKCAGPDTVTCPWSTTCPCGSLPGVTTPPAVGSNCSCGVEQCVTDSYGRQALSCSHGPCGVGKECCVTTSGPVCQTTGSTCTPP